MKEGRIKLLTVLGLIVLLLLQSIWIYNMYNSVYNDVKEVICSSLYESMFKDIMIRFKTSIPEGTQMKAGKMESDGKMSHVYFQQALIDHNAPISIEQLDSIYTEDLLQKKIDTKIVINKINPQTNDVLESTDSNFHASWGCIYTDTIPLRTDSTEAIQAIIVSPYKIVVERMSLLMVASAILMIFIGWCLVYQIRIIITQNRIAKLRKDFSNAMVHDMKSPLTSILIGTRMLRSGKIDDYPEKKEKHFGIMESECEHLLSLSNKILTMAKIEENKLTLDRTNVPLMPLLNDLAEKFKSHAEKNVSFDIHCHHRAESVYADKTHLNEAISNLIDNAIKYSGESVNIEIICYREKDLTKIKVSDNGFGIPLKEQVLIFEKFERASAARKRSLRNGATGFGIGLSYVQQVMQAHGGTVEVESVEGKGSDFTISFPVLTEEITDDKETI